MHQRPAQNRFEVALQAADVTLTPVQQTAAVQLFLHHPTLKALQDVVTLIQRVATKPDTYWLRSDLSLRQVCGDLFGDEGFFGVTVEEVH